MCVSSEFDEQLDVNNSVLMLKVVLIDSDLVLMMKKKVKNCAIREEKPFMNCIAYIFSNFRVILYEKNVVF